MLRSNDKFILKMVFRIRIIGAPAPRRKSFALGETPGKKLIRHRIAKKGKNGMDTGKIPQMLRKYVGVCAFIVVGVGLLFSALLAREAYAEDEVVVYSARIEQLIKPMFDAFTAQT